MIEEEEMKELVEGEDVGGGAGAEAGSSRRRRPRRSGRRVELARGGAAVEGGRVGEGAAAGGGPPPGEGPPSGGDLGPTTCSAEGAANARGGERRCICASPFGEHAKWIMCMGAPSERVFV
jgi:hypothetical protein